MRKFHPFYVIGSVGTVVVALLHLFFALGLGLSSMHSLFFVLYSTFISFIVLGVVLSVKNRKEFDKKRNEIT